MGTSPPKTKTNHLEIKCTNWHKALDKQIPFLTQPYKSGITWGEQSPTKNNKTIFRKTKNKKQIEGNLQKEK